MATTARPTVELDPRLYRALKRQARGSKRSLTRLVNEALTEALEDAHDLAVARQRLRRREKGRPFEEFLRELRREGKP
ncbi:MAG: CopG family transcriptional regulator [Acidobacteria bacterium]|nr:CopG family transcriptional regulator [Acidobacteriota bacterium]